MGRAQVYFRKVIEKIYKSFSHEALNWSVFPDESCQGSRANPKA